jgi:ABC-2 type transport system ATP-binding protein
LKQDVRDLAVIEIEVFGVPMEILDRIRNLPFVDTVSVEDLDQKQALHVHSAKGSEAVPALLASLESVRVGKVTVREPTLEDAYVRLVGGKV